MLKKFLATSFAVAAASFASAQTLSVAVSNITTDATNGNFSNGSTFIHGVNKFTLDMLVTLSNTADDWTAGGMKAVTFAGAKWYYNGLDPNNPQPTAPGTASPAKFSTFVNNPRSQFINGRFTTATAFAGSYNPPSTTLIASPTEFNVAWLESPPVSTSLDTAAAVARLTLDTLGTSFTAIRVGSLTHNVGNNAIPNAAPNAGETTLAQVQLATGSQLNGGTLTYDSFYIYGTPEPASLALLALGGLLLRRR